MGPDPFSRKWGVTPLIRGDGALSAHSRSSAIFSPITTDSGRVA